MNSITDKPTFFTQAQQKNATHLLICDSSNREYAADVNLSLPDVAAVCVSANASLDSLIYPASNRIVSVRTALPFALELQIASALYRQGAKSVRIHRNGHWIAHRAPQFAQDVA